MDLLGIALKSALEGFTNLMNLAIDFLMTVLYSATTIDVLGDISEYLSPLETYLKGVVFTLLGTIILLSILKQLLQENDIEFTDRLFRVLFTTIAISAIPIFLNYIEPKADILVKEMLELIKIPVPDVSKINYTAFIINVTTKGDNLANTAAVTMVSIAIISLVCMIALFIQTVYYKVLLKIMHLISPFMGLGVLSYNFGILTVFIKDILGIYVIRILQLVLIKISFTLVIGAIVSAIETMATEIALTIVITTIFKIMVGMTFMIVLLFLPNLVKKYTNTNMGGDLKGIAGSLAGLGKMALGGK